MQNGTIFEKSQNIFLKRGGVMAYLSDDELLDTEGGFTGWDDGTGAGAEERLAELESELEQDEHPIDYEAELEDEEEAVALLIKEILDRFDNETEVDRTTAFKAALNYVMRQGEEEKKSLEGIAATLTVLLEKVLDEEQNMEGQDS